MANARAIHLGDGAYATLQDDGDMVLTSGTHELHLATNVIFLDPRGINKLLEFIKNPLLGDVIQ